MPVPVCVPVPETSNGCDARREPPPTIEHCRCERARLRLAQRAWMVWGGVSMDGTNLGPDYDSWNFCQQVAG